MLETAPPASLTRVQTAKSPVTHDNDEFQLEVPFFEPDSANDKLPGRVEHVGAAQSPHTLAQYTVSKSDHATHEIEISLPDEPVAPDLIVPPTESPTPPKQEEVEAFERALQEALKQPVSQGADALNFSSSSPDGQAEPPSAPYGTNRHAAAKANTPFGFGLSAERDATALSLNKGYTSESDDNSQTKNRRWPGLIFTVLCILGLVILIAQLVFFNRARIATEIPELRPTLERACQALGCQVPLPKDLQFIRTEWSDCPQLPEHPNVLHLQAKVKNRAPYPQSWPTMEFTLKDANDLVLIRKIITPKEYLKLEDYKTGRFKANSEIAVDMLLDVGEVRPRGYSIYWFYP